MNRLIGSTKSVNGTNTQQFSYDYDRFGNRWKQNVLLGSGPAPQYTFSGENNRIDGYSYDAAGNLLNDQLGNTFTYDAEGHVVAARSTYTYDYDAFGRRIRTSYTGTGPYKLEYLYDQSGRWVTQVDGNDGHIRWEEAYAGGRHIATLSGAQWHWNHVDWLGTERYRTDSSGNSAETCTNLPFGDSQSCTGTDWSSSHFAGTVSDLGGAHTWFRQLNTTEGRWTSPDPLAGDITNPQSLNRYAYSLNDPIDLLDPLGLCPPGQREILKQGGGKECIVPPPSPNPDDRDPNPNTPGGGDDLPAGVNPACVDQGSNCGGVTSGSVPSNRLCIPKKTLSRLQQAELAALQFWAGLTGKTWGVGVGIDGAGGWKFGPLTVGGGGSASTLIVVNPSGTSGILNSASAGFSLMKAKGKGRLGGGLATGVSVMEASKPGAQLAGGSAVFSAAGGAVLGAAVDFSSTGSKTFTFGPGVGAELGFDFQGGKSKYIPICPE